MSVQFRNRPCRLIAEDEYIQSPPRKGAPQLCQIGLEIECLSCHSSEIDVYKNIHLK